MLFATVQHNLQHKHYDHIKKSDSAGFSKKNLLTARCGPVYAQIWSKILSRSFLANNLPMRGVVSFYVP